MTFRRLAVLVAAAAAFALTGCAGQTAVQTAGPASAADSADPSASPEASTGPSAGKPTAKGGETITGTVSAGVEPGCLILQASQSQHLLLFDDPELRAEAKIGATITVTGRAEPAQLTTCQQGVPFIVTAVQAN